MNTAARIHNFHIGRTFKSHFKFTFATSAICNMRMWIDKSRCDEMTCCICNFGFMCTVFELLF